MRAITITALGLMLATACGPAAAQTFSARRMAMGGVVLGGSDGAGSNVAYRAVPGATHGARNFSLPLGLIPVLSDPPQLNPRKPDFNIYDLANLLYTAPWNLQLTSPEPPSSDVVVSVSKDSLAVDLGDVADVFPLESKIGAVVSPSMIGAGLMGAFIGLVPLVHYRNELTLNDALHAALAEGRPFVPRTDYALFDNALAQAAVGAEAGLARPLFKEGDTRAGGFALYGGARVKLLRGLAYGDADNQVTFTTGDTLFTNPVDIQYVGHLREAGPGDGGWGAGLDLGAVWIGRGVEVGVGVNDIGTQIGWKVRETLIYSDPSAGGYVTQVLNDAASFTSRVPTVVTVNVAYQAGPVLIAGDVVTGSGTTQLHIGSEMWRGPWAMRAGTFVDSEQGLQGGCGAGFRLGKFGFDLALSSHSRNLSSARALELGAALSLYH